MSKENVLRVKQKARIGCYSIGLQVYWNQFPGLFDCLMGYNQFLGEGLGCFGELYNFGMVDTEEKGKEAGEYFNRNNVDIVFVHAATYCTSSCVLPVHQICKAPVIVLNLQPTPQMSYEITGTDRWLAQCVACPIPEISNAFNRAGIQHWGVNGLLGLRKTPVYAKSDEVTFERPEAQAAWQEMEQWCKAASVKRTLQYGRFGFLGGYYTGMLDMYSDFTMLQAQLGVHIEIVEMGELEARVATVTQDEVDAKREEMDAFFEISGDSPSDSIARKPTAEQLDWSAKVAVAQKKLVIDKQLDSVSYYYHGSDDLQEAIQSGFIVGFSMLNAQGIACAGEGDIKTALAMKICDILSCGGSFCEIVAADFNQDTLILGHDGPFHIAISKGKPLLRGMGVYHGKRGSGVSVEAKVRTGAVTTLGITQTMDGRLQFNISEGMAVDEPILMNGNTSTHIRFKEKPIEYMDKWFTHAPTHHLALSVGHNSSQFMKVAELMNIPYAVF